MNGLDDEAIKSVNQWRFEPGKRNGVPVRVMVTIDVQFALAGPASTWPKAFGLPYASNPSANDGPWNVSRTDLGDSKQEVTATCTVVFPVCAPDSDVEQILGEAGPDFARMLRRMQLETP